MYPPNLNVPLPDASGLAPEQTLQGPDRTQQALSLIAPLFALGTSIGGSPHAGASLLHGAQSAIQAQDQQRQQRAAQQQQIALRQQQMAQQQQVAAAAAEAKRQADIQAYILNTKKSLDGVTDRKTYEDTIGFAENMGQAFYGLRPNTLRGLIPYRAPDAKKNLYSAVEQYLKNPVNKATLEQGGAAKAAIKVDTDGDGVPDKPVLLSEAIAESGYPVFLDPETQKPILIEKPLKPENVQPFDLAYRGLVERFATEKGRQPTDPERGQIAVQAQRSLDKPPAAGADGGLKDYQKFTAGEKLADKWTKINTPLREMNRQFDLMRTGLRRFKQGDRLGGSQAVLVTFQKILDPSSVVRESEYARSASGLSLISRLEGAVEKLRAGGAGVPVEDLAGMVETARQMLSSMQSYSTSQKKRIAQTANQYGIDPALVFDDLVPPEEPAPDEPAEDRPPGHAQTPYSVGQVVLVKGQKVRVTKLNPDGTYEGTVVR